MSDFGKFAYNASYDLGSYGYVDSFSEEEIETVKVRLKNDENGKLRMVVEEEKPSFLEENNLAVGFHD